MQRRGFAGLGAGALAMLAGCSTRRVPYLGPEAPPATSPDAAPAEYLPSPGEPWERVDTNEVAAQQAGAVAGVAATYGRPDETEEFNVEILRWPSSDDARQTAPNYYGGWKVFVRREQWSFAARGPDHDRVTALLGHSPVLTTPWVREYDEGRG